MDEKFINKDKELQDSCRFIAKFYNEACQLTNFNTNPNTEFSNGYRAHICLETNMFYSKKCSQNNENNHKNIKE